MTAQSASSPAWSDAPLSAAASSSSPPGLSALASIAWALAILTPLIYGLLLRWKLGRRGEDQAATEQLDLRLARLQPRWATWPLIFCFDLTTTIAFALSWTARRELALVFLYAAVQALPFLLFFLAVLPPGRRWLSDRRRVVTIGVALGVNACFVAAECVCIGRDVEVGGRNVSAIVFLVRVVGSMTIGLVLFGGRRWRGAWLDWRRRLGRAEDKHVRKPIGAVYVAGRAGWWSCAVLVVVILVVVIRAVVQLGWPALLTETFDAGLCWCVVIFVEIGIVLLWWLDRTAPSWAELPELDRGSQVNDKPEKPADADCRVLIWNAVDGMVMYCAGNDGAWEQIGGPIERVSQEVADKEPSSMGSSEFVTIDVRPPAAKLLNDADAYILMFSAQNPHALKGVRRRYDEVRRLAMWLHLRPGSPPPMVVTALVDGQRRLVLAEQGQALADELRCAYTELSIATSADPSIARRQSKDVMDLARGQAQAWWAGSSIDGWTKTASKGSAVITNIPTMTKELDFSSPAAVQGYVAAAARADASLPSGGAIALSSGPISRVVRIAVVGPSCVGKTRLVSSLLSSNDQDSPSVSPGQYISTTVETHSTSVEVDGEICPVEVVDTGGNEQIRSQVAEMLWKADVCIAVYDRRWPQTGADLSCMLEDLVIDASMLPYGSRARPPVVVVAFDGRPVAPSSQRSASGRASLQLPREWSWVWVEASATRPASIADAFRMAVRQAKSGCYDHLV